MKYAVLYEERLALDNGYGDAYIKKVPSYIEFHDQNALLDWINFKAKDIGTYKVIEYNEIKVKVKLEIERPQVTRGPREEYERASIVKGSEIRPVSIRLVN